MNARVAALALIVGALPSPSAVEAQRTTISPRLERLVARDTVVAAWLPMEIAERDNTPGTSRA